MSEVRDAELGRGGAGVDDAASGQDTVDDRGVLGGNVSRVDSRPFEEGTSGYGVFLFGGDGDAL
jgi:hypothetical protein